MCYTEGAMPVMPMGLLLDLGALAAILVLVIFAALMGYAVGTLRLVLQEVREMKAQAQEDRKVNESDHDRLFNEVSDLKADVKVLRDRSDRSSADAG